MRITKNTHPHDLDRHPRCSKGAVVRTGSDGLPEVVARVYIVTPSDGAGRLWVGVQDYAHPDGPRSHVAYAGGYGYDKVTAALCGATIGGIEIGDYCDHKGRMTISELCQSNGWLYVEP